MQGLWARRGKINLNSTPPVTPDEQPTTTPVVEEQPPTTPNDETKLLAEPTNMNKRKTRDPASSSNTKRPKLAPVPAKEYSPPSARLSDLGGIDDCISKLLEVVAMPLCHPEIYLALGVSPPRGVLLHGPPGCGKTLLANAIAGELGVPFVSISAPSIVSGMSGESEKGLREAFDEATRVAPALLFIDEIDAITPKRESAQREMERRIVAQFLTCMDDLSLEKTSNKPVIVMGATNRPDSLDPALRRAGRFDHEISIGVPDDQGRENILRVLASKLKLEGDFNFTALAKATPGYVGADLSALTAAAGIVAVKRIFKGLTKAPVSNDVEMTFDVETPDFVNIDAQQGPASQAFLPTPAPFSQLFSSTSTSSSIAVFLSTHPSPLTTDQLSPLSITFEDFLSALPSIQPSALREGFTTVPSTSFADIGALHSIRSELHFAVVEQIKRPGLYAKVGVSSGGGVLLWGPPGCGKTLLAKAVANASGANFISVKGPEVLNKYVGESERAIRQLFSRARSSSPCIVFFDELDALVPRRDDALSESSARVVNTLLTELDGLDARKSVYVIGATNRPDMIDPAMCRPGRLDKLLYVDLPTPPERAEIVRTMIQRRNVPLPPDTHSLEQVESLVRSNKCEGYSGADLAALVREAGVAALRRVLASLPPDEQVHEESEVRVTVDDFEGALDKVTPSVSKLQRRKYETLRNKLAGLPVGKGKDVEVEGDNKGEVGVPLG
ncbi:Ribosome biogenesis ATPase rix7 [Paramarasmius palmivorus]|uniref:Ribosome biogenesis ATPase rix7 n=1 Tax=Paramarasmius palmivorus TaxID=297713 RepID=A0AAW0CX93_9AGAR